MKTLRGSISKLRRPKLPLRHPLLGHAWLRQTERYRRQLLRLFRCAKSATHRANAPVHLLPPHATRAGKKPTICLHTGKPSRLSSLEMMRPQCWMHCAYLAPQAVQDTGVAKEGSARGERPSQLRVPSPRIRFCSFQTAGIGAVP